MMKKMDKLRFKNYSKFKNTIKSILKMKKNKKKKKSPNLQHLEVTILIF